MKKKLKKPPQRRLPKQAPKPKKKGGAVGFIILMVAFGAMVPFIYPTHVSAGRHAADACGAFHRK